MQQRETKFRAWDNIDKVMKYFDFFDIHCGVHHPYHWKDSTGLACELDDKKRYPNNLMRLTGLKDKNGKEIYEADLIEHPQYPTPLRVEWDYDQWGLFDGICNEASIDEGCKIIGNIYENKDLLKNV